MVVKFEYFANRSPFNRIRIRYAIVITRKPCYRKDIARCCSCMLRLDFANNTSLRVTKPRKPGFGAVDIPAQNRI